MFLWRSYRNAASDRRIGAYWVTELCSGIVKDGCILKTGNVVYWYHFIKTKVFLWFVVHTEGLNC